MPLLKPVPSTTSQLPPPSVQVGVHLGLWGGVYSTQAMVAWDDVEMHVTRIVLETIINNVIVNISRN